MGNKKNINIIIIFAIIGTLGFFLYWSSQQQKEQGNINITATYESDTTLSGDYILSKDERVVVKNGAIVTIEGNANVRGTLSCENGPLQIVANGKLFVDGKLECDRASELPQDDIGNGIVITAKGDVEFGASATIVTNGHVQIVDDQGKLATTADAIQKIYDDSGTDSGEGMRLGPFIPIELAQNGVSLNTGKTKLPSILLFANRFIYAANAQEPAKDIEGNVVPNTVKVGGTWIVGGFPTGSVPGNLTLPIPPKGVDKIILNFQFGQGKNVTLQDW